MSGGDNNPEYSGGPEPTWWGTAAVVLVILVLSGLVIYALLW
jgi:hypothetical protein